MFKSYQPIPTAAPTPTPTTRPTLSPTSSLDPEPQNLNSNGNGGTTDHRALTTVIVFLAVLLALTLCGIGAYWAHRREVMKSMKSMVRTMSYHPNQVGFDQETPNGERSPHFKSHNGHSHQGVKDEEDSSPEPSLIKAAPQHMMTTNGLMMTKTGDTSEDDDAQSELDEDDDDRTIASLTTPYNGTFGSRTPDMLSIGTRSIVTNFGTQSIGLSEVHHQFGDHPHGGNGYISSPNRSGAHSGVSTAISGGDLYPKSTEISIDISGMARDFGGGSSGGISSGNGMIKVQRGMIDSNGMGNNYGAHHPHGPPPHGMGHIQQISPESGMVPQIQAPSQFKRNVPFKNINPKQFKMLQAAIKKCRTPSDFQRLGSIVKSGQVPDHEPDDDDDDDDDDDIDEDLERNGTFQRVQHVQPSDTTESEDSGYDDHDDHHHDHDDHHVNHHINHHDNHQGQRLMPRKETEESMRTSQRRESSLDKEDLSNRLEVLAKLEPLPALKGNLHESRLDNGY